MKRTLMIFAVAASLLASCEKYGHIDNSIWINDPDDICLPKYSEWGYNTFGAVMGRSYFVSSWVEIPSSVYHCVKSSSMDVISATNFLLSAIIFLLFFEQKRCDVKSLRIPS